MALRINRRSFMGYLCCAGAGALASGLTARAAERTTSLTADQALATLKEGTTNF